MTQKSLKEIFSAYSKRAELFRDRDVLTDKYMPEKPPHREEQINHIGQIVAPAIRGHKISNLFVFGNVGTGKTLVTKHVMGELGKTTEDVKAVYINCKMKKTSDTEYRLLAELCKVFGKNVPSTGLPTEEVYKIFYNLLNQLDKNIILVLDEIDAIVKKIGDDILYNLTRINQELKKTKIAILGISNDVSFIENLDPRVKSSLSEEEIVFPPYNAIQLRDILKQRGELAFHDNVIGSGVIEKCAALAAQEHGDARKALDLMRIAGELAERDSKSKITVEYIDKAENKLDLDKYVETVKNAPKQSKAILSATIKLIEDGNKNIQTGDVFSVYEKICKKSGLKILTQRRVSDLVGELDMMGILNTSVISKGRYGRTREIKLLLDKHVLNNIKKILVESQLL